MRGLPWGGGRPPGAAPGARRHGKPPKQRVARNRRDTGSLVWVARRIDGWLVAGFPPRGPSAQLRSKAGASHRAHAFAAVLAGRRSLGRLAGLYRLSHSACSDFPDAACRAAWQGRVFCAPIVATAPKGRELVAAALGRGRQAPESHARCGWSQPKSTTTHTGPAAESRQPAPPSIWRAAQTSDPVSRRFPAMCHFGRSPWRRAPGAAPGTFRRPGVATAPGHPLQDSNPQSSD